MKNAKNAKLKKAVLLVSFMSFAVIGCELIVDFDRTKIPVQDGGAVGDTGGPPPADAASEAETSTDAMPDADASDDGGDGGDAADADAADS